MPRLALDGRADPLVGDQGLLRLGELVELADAGRDRAGDLADSALAQHGTATLAAATDVLRNLAEIYDRL
ncbi:hypothetical protein [Kitasatospora sp. GP82]|uniref:hypothetical protein n=1 Tax=Kitasatospora sp. GP82 TaxID=3035089 RepID=UPI0024753209|nr:hypothetical protein [Kitasatospora sp. GP82]MDH6129546.1 hypothetical protein [Kitasatospora sp. GP82]